MKLIYAAKSKVRIKKGTYMSIMNNIFFVTINENVSPLSLQRLPCKESISNHPSLFLLTLNTVR